MNFAEIVQEQSEKLTKLVIEKNAAYGNSFMTVPRILTLLFPHGIPLELYVDALGIVRALDKICRIANQKSAFGEDPWEDLEGYCKAARANAELERLKLLTEETEVKHIQSELPLKLTSNCAYCNHPPSSHAPSTYSGERHICRQALDTAGLALCPCDDFR